MPLMQTAFKEWAVVVDALIRGEQIIILRKGGIREGKAGFRVLADRFWLFPTQFHQQGEAVTYAARRRFDEIRANGDSGESVRIQAMVELVESCELEDWTQITKLGGQHVWRESVIKERFEWGRKKAVFVLVVRVYRLRSPVSIPFISKYSGCRSWIELEPPMPSEGLAPVLSDADFARQAARFHEAIESCQPR